MAEARGRFRGDEVFMGLGGDRIERAGGSRGRGFENEEVGTWWVREGRDWF